MIGISTSSAIGLTIRTATAPRSAEKGRGKAGLGLGRLDLFPFQHGDGRASVPTALQLIGRQCVQRRQAGQKQKRHGERPPPPTIVSTKPATLAPKASRARRSGRKRWSKALTNEATALRCEPRWRGGIGPKLTKPSWASGGQSRFFAGRTEKLHQIKILPKVTLSRNHD